MRFLLPFAAAALGLAAVSCSAINGERVVVVGGENAAYSPDGRKAAFQKLRNGTYDLGVVELSSGRVTWVVEGEGNAIFPSWTPDGGLVYVYGNDTNTAFSAMKNRSQDGYNLYLYKNGNTVQLTHGRWRESTPFVAPQGDVYFVRSEGEYASDHALMWKMPLDRPSEARRIRGSSFASGAGVSQPSVSPDGRYLVWAEIYGGNWDAWNLRIARMDDPEADRVLIPMRQTAFEPRWCPDSRTIVYSGFEEGDPGWGVYLMDVKCGCYRRLCDGRGGVVSPDGTRLMYSSCGELRERRVSRDDYPKEGRDKSFREIDPSAEPGKVLLSGGPVDRATIVPFKGPDFGRDKTFYCRVRIRFNGAKPQQDFINVDFGDWGPLAFRIFCTGGIPYISTMYDKTEWIPMLGPRRLEAGEHVLTGIRGGDGRLYFSIDDCYPLMRPMTQYYVPLDGPRGVILSRNLNAGSKWYTTPDGAERKKAEESPNGFSQVLEWEVGSGWPKNVPRLFGCHLAPCCGEAYVKGNLNHPERVMKVGWNLEVAFDFLRTHDLKTLPVGKIEIDGDNVFAFVSTPVLKPFDDPGGLVEVHRRYIDIHVPIEGVETIGCLDIDSLPDGIEFNEKDDYALFSAKTDPMTVKPGEFVAFFPPRGAHRPACTMGAAAETNALRKICVKVKHLQD